MIKAELRTLYKAKRQALPAETVEADSDQISHRWQEWLSRTDRGFIDTYIHIFLPIHSQNEINTWPIINWLRQHCPSTHVVTSVADLKTGTLASFELTPATELITNRYGIPEPNPATSLPVATSAIDLVLVPLLIVDKRGHRVGYGGGFYDRFLAECRPSCLTIGLSLFEPIDCIDDVASTDVKLDACITPDGINWF